MAEIEALRGALTDVEFRLTQQELKAKMDLARVGRCTYGSGREFDVEQMSCAPNVLELRLTTRTGEDDEGCLIRLYFSEPQARTGELLALMLTWKRPGPKGVDEQTAHALAASRRLDEHEQWLTKT